METLLAKSVSLSVLRSACFGMDGDARDGRGPVEFAGACAVALAKGVKVEADPTLWRIVDGKLYVFALAKALPLVDANAQAIIAKAAVNNEALADQPFKPM